MKRRVEREKKISAFSVEIRELEALWKRMVVLFDDPENVESSIDIILPSEKLQFRNVDELKEYSDLRGRVAKFSLWISQKDKSISIRSSQFFYSSPTITASSATEAWCAGAIETVCSFLKSYKTWYHWLVSAPLGLFLFVTIMIPNIILILRWNPSTHEGTLNKSESIGWLSAVFVMTIFYTFRGKIFPPAVLSITKEENFIRRYSAELGVIMFIITALLSVVGWYIGK